MPLYMECICKHGHIFTVHVLQGEPTSLTAETITLIIAISVLSGHKMHRTPLGELTTLPQTPYSVVEGDTPPHSSPPRCLDSHAFGVRLGGFLLAYITSIP